MTTNAQAATAPTFDDLSTLSGDGQQDQQGQKPTTRPAFCPPHVNIGDTIFWYSAAKRGNRPCPMLVCDVEGNVVSGHVFAKGKLPLPVHGIRHIDDPHLQSHQFVAVKDGAWDRKGQVTPSSL